MKTFVAFVSVILFVFCAIAEAKTLVLHKPTILIVDPEPVKASSEQEAFEDAEAESDFYFYADKIKKNLNCLKSITVVERDVDLIKFSNTGEKPITRKELNGLGYIFFKPNSKPNIFKGVATDFDVICEASRYFKVKIDGYDCNY